MFKRKTVKLIYKLHSRRTLPTLFNFFTEHLDKNSTIKVIHVEEGLLNDDIREITTNI